MKIVILTQYYPPETGAPQNRLSDLAKRLHALGHSVTVLTAMPNYPEMRVHKGYRYQSTKKEVQDNIVVLRSWIFVSKKRSIIPRLLNYFSFVCSSFWIGLFRLGKKDVLICESPPLFLGITGWMLCKCKGAKFVFNISDLWPESAEKMGIVTNKRFLGMAYRLERLLYRKSKLVTGQTKGICANINHRFPDIPTYWFPNGVDSEQFSLHAPATFRHELNIDQDTLVLGYGGIIGHAQGLEVMIEAADILRNDDVMFLVAGDGPEKAKLQQMQQEKNLKNVHFLGHLPRERMPEVISSSDAAFVPLRKLDLFKGAIPSKIFENLAMKKPLILGVEGEAKQLFIDEAKAGIFYEPENAESLAAAIRQMKASDENRSTMGEHGRQYVLAHFNRKELAKSLADALEQL